MVNYRHKQQIDELEQKPKPKAKEVPKFLEPLKVPNGQLVA